MERNGTIFVSQISPSSTKHTSVSFFASLQGILASLEAKSSAGKTSINGFATVCKSWRIEKNPLTRICLSETGSEWNVPLDVSEPKFSAKNGTKREEKNGKRQITDREINCISLCISEPKHKPRSLARNRSFGFGASFSISQSLSPEDDSTKMQ